MLRIVSFCLVALMSFTQSAVAETAQYKRILLQGLTIDGRFGEPENYMGMVCNLLDPNMRVNLHISASAKANVVKRLRFLERVSVMSSELENGMIKVESTDRIYKIDGELFTPSKSQHKMGWIDAQNVCDYALAPK